MRCPFSGESRRCGVTVSGGMPQAFSCAGACEWFAWDEALVMYAILIILKTIERKVLRHAPNNHDDCPHWWSVERLRGIKRRR